MAVKVINGVEFTAIRFIYGHDSDVQDGLLIHDMNDLYSDGDYITSGTLPADEAEADSILQEYPEHSYAIDENGIYRVHCPWYAVMRNDDDDWGNGSFYMETALDMARKERESGYDEAYVAVIEGEGRSEICVEEIHDID